MFSQMVYSNKSFWMYSETIVVKEYKEVFYNFK